MIIKNLVRLKEVSTLSTSCYSLDFDGVNEYIDCTNNSIFDIDGVDSFSFSGWIKKTGATFFPVFAKLSYPNAATIDGYRCYIHPTTNILTVNLYGSSGSNIRVHTINPLSSNVWLHLSVTYDGSETAAGVKIFVNGILVSIGISVDTFVGTMINTEPLTLGGQPTPTNPLYALGNYAQARMWNTELSPIEVLTEYNNGLNSASVQTGNLILNTDISRSTFNGLEWDIPDLTGITSGYQTVLMEVGDRVLDCP